MFNNLKRLYLEGRLSEAGLENAVEKGWITSEQKGRIVLLKALTDASEKAGS